MSTAVHIRGKLVNFSFWPMRKDSHGYVPQLRVFSSNPWNIIRQVVDKSCPDNTKVQAQAFLDQAEDFFNAGHFGNVRIATKPLLIYYSFMNLVKAFSVTRKIVDNVSRFDHGLMLRDPNAKLPHGQKLVASPVGSEGKNLFAILLKGIGGKELKEKKEYDLYKDIFPQILLGHRLWCGAEDADVSKERFFEIIEPLFFYDESKKKCRIGFLMNKAEFHRFDYTIDGILAGAGLDNNWSKSESGSSLGVYMKNAKNYTNDPSDVINDLVNEVRHQFWCSVKIDSPFRKYYIHVAENRNQVMPQLCSIYAVFFYLGSITRYHPDQFEGLIAGEHGAFIREFIQVQPNQWLYLMASEFAERDVAKAAVV